MFEHIHTQERGSEAGENCIMTSFIICAVHQLCVLDAVAWAKNILWVHSCLSACRVSLSNWTGGSIVATHFCAAMGFRVPHCLATIGPWMTLVQGRPLVIVGRHCCATVARDQIRERITQDATMPSDHISVTTTYFRWREEHLRNVSVLQRVHLSRLILLGYSNQGGWSSWGPCRTHGGEMRTKFWLKNMGISHRGT
jgi:hypothetical protein